MRPSIHKIALCICLCTIFSHAFSQNWNWSNQNGSTNYDGAADIVVDNSGNCYYTGSFSGQVCYFTNDTSGICQGDNDLYIIKYDANGNEVWFRQLGANNIGGTCSEGIGSVTIDADNNVYVAGSFCDYITIGNTNLTGRGSEIFITKLDTSGRFIWAKKAGGNGIDEAGGIAADGIGNLYICGLNSSTAFFETDSIPAGGFIAKYDTSGALVWVKNRFRYWHSGSVNAEIIPTDIKVYNSNLLICGTSFNDTLIVDTITRFTQVTYSNSCAMAFDTSGNIKWLDVFGGGNSTVGYDFTIDNSGNMFIAGAFNYPGYFGHDTLSSSNLGDVYVAKIDINGAMQWVRQINASNGGWGLSSSTDQSDGSTYFTGYFEGSASFGTYNLTASSSRDMFLTRYDTYGNCLGVRNFGYAEGHGVAQDLNGSPYVCGMFRGTIHIGSNTFSNYGQTDVFVAKCDVFTSIDEEKHLANNQLIIYANPNSGKCNLKVPDEFLNERKLLLSIFDNSGKLLQQKHLEGGNDKIDLNLETYSKGVYTVALSNGRNIYRGKIVFE